MRNLTGGIVLALAAAASGAGQTPAAEPCRDAAFHQLDFWVGEWDVYGPKGRKIAQSRIESVYGCGIRENWMPFNGQPGGSLSIYVPGEKRWEQFYIDSSGSRARLQGGWTDGKMVLNRVWDPSDKDQMLSRMSYARNADGSVRQFGEQSTDQGKTWTITFDLLYRRGSSD